MPTEPPPNPSSSATNRMSLRSFTKKGQETAPPKPAPITAQPSLSRRKDAKDLNKRLQMGSQSARQSAMTAVPAPAPALAPSPSRAPAAALTSNPVAFQEGNSPRPLSQIVPQHGHATAKRTAHSIMTGAEPETEAVIPQGATVSGSRRPDQGLSRSNREDGDYRASASYLMKLGILLNVEALFKTSPDEVQELLADLGRTYPDLLEGAGLQRLAR